MHKALDKSGAVLGLLVAYGLLAGLGERLTTYRTLFRLALIPAFLAVALLALMPEPSGERHEREHFLEAWQAITQALHLKGSRLFLQLWYVGRISHPSLQPDQALPVAPSALRPIAQAYTSTGYQPCVTPRALETAEIPLIVEYVQAACNALAAGFDGVEIHAANGYLIEQFLRESCNRRTDAYGGSVERRARFLLDVVAGVVGACGADGVGIRLSRSAQ